MLKHFLAKPREVVAFWWQTVSFFHQYTMLQSDMLKELYCVDSGV